MKKLIVVLALLLTLTTCLAMFAACNENETPTESSDDSTAPEVTPPEESDTVKVYWYEGTKELRVDEVKKGEKVTSWTPTSDSGEFDGWYAEASKETPFDFDKPITEDTDIFAKFKSNEWLADENAYYLIGAGAGDMGNANWDHANAAANLMMTKEDIEGKNIYTITIKMFAGDMFQICFGGAWDGQQGIGYMKGAEYCDGNNFYDHNDYTAADKKVAQVKDADGNVVFIGSDEYNKGFEVWNIKLADGQDGIYKFTFTTNPAAKDYNLLEWELVEKIEPMTETHKMYFIGTMNEWGTEYAEDSTLALVPSTDKSTWTGIITITEDMYADWTADADGNLYAALKIYNTVSGGYFSPDGENVLLREGTYAFKYSVDGDKVEFAKCEYYVVGTFVDAEGKAVNFAVKDGVTPKLENGTVTLTATDVTALGDYSWIKDQGKPGVMAVKVVFGCEYGIKDWFSDDANNGDNFYLTEGEHTITLTFDADGKATVAIDAPPATDDPTAKSYKMELKLKDKTLYAKNVLDGYYIATTANADEAAVFTLEAVEGGYHLSTVVDGAKKYLNIVASGKYFNPKFEDAASSVWVYDEATNSYITSDAYLGTYEKNDGSIRETIGGSALSYIQGENAAKVDISQFVCRLIAQ